MQDSLKHVPLKKRVISRIDSNKLALTITLFLSGTFFKDSRNLYPRRGRKSLCAHLAVELEDLVDIRAGGEAAVLAHEVGERVVAVGHVALRQEGRVVEAHVLPARHVAEEVVHKVKLGGLFKGASFNGKTLSLKFHFNPAQFEI